MGAVEPNAGQKSDLCCLTKLAMHGDDNTGFLYCAAFLKAGQRACWDADGISRCTG